MRRNNDLHTEVIIAKDRERAMGVFLVLEFAGIELTVRMEKGDEALTRTNIGRPEKPDTKQQARRW
jgi:hypothetical protein